MKKRINIYVYHILKDTIILYNLLTIMWLYCSVRINLIIE